MKTNNACSALFLACLGLVAAQSGNNDPNGKTLFIAYPACDYYRCNVTWNLGQSTYVQWLNPPDGNVSIALNSQTNTSLSYTIANSTLGMTACQNVTDGASCGQYNFTVPLDWSTQGNYSVSVTSLNTGAAGYSDFVLLAPALPNATVSASEMSGIGSSTLPAGLPWRSLDAQTTSGATSEWASRDRLVGLTALFVGIVALLS